MGMVKYLNFSFWLLKKRYRNKEDWMEKKEYKRCIRYSIYELYNILKKYQSYNNCFFIIYEELTNPNYVKMLLEKINFNQVENSNLNYFKNSNKKEIDIDYAKDTYENAKDIYIDIKHKFIYSNSSN